MSTKHSIPSKLSQPISDLTQIRLSVALFGVLLLCVIPLLYEALTVTIISLSSLLIIAQSLMLYKTTWLMNSVKHVTLIKNLGAIVFSTLIAINAKQLGLLNAMVNLLFSGALLWLVTADLKTPKWARQLFVVSAMLTSVSFIYQQDLHWSVWALIVMLGLFVGLYWCQSAFSFQAIQRNHSVRLIPPRFTVMVITCLVLTAIAFVVLPALKPFWKLPDQKQNATGLDNKMTPGDVADLAQSNRLAFRVELSGDPALNQLLQSSHAERYWRVLTLEQFDGKTWKQHSSRQVSRRYSPLLSSSQVKELEQQHKSQQPLTLSVIAEPSHQPWLLSYGTSIPQSSKIGLTKDSRLLANTKVTKRIKYEAVNLNSNNLIQPNQQTIALNLRLPNNGLIKTKALASELLAKAMQNVPSNSISQVNNSVPSVLSTTPQNPMPPDAVIARFNALFFQYMREQEFSYTLQPPVLQGDHIDDFLFNSKQGFCAHFASAHATLLRAIGVPARIVTGYHGGELNPNGNYLNIYDSSAHAWVEFVDNSNQWRRIDPTGAVAPSRISEGLESTLGSNEALAANAINFVKQTPWLNELRQQIQSLDYYWTVWVLDFDNNKRQNTVSQYLTFDKIAWSLMVFIITIVFIALFIWLGRWFKRPPVSIETYVINYLYQKANKLSKGHSSKATDSPTPQIDWSLTLNQHQSKLQSQLPEYQSEISEVINALNRYLYAGPHHTMTPQRSSNLNVPFISATHSVATIKKEFRNMIDTIK